MMYYIRLFSDLDVLSYSISYGRGTFLTASKVWKSDPIYTLIEHHPSVISRKAYSGSSGGQPSGYLYQNALTGDFKIYKYLNLSKRQAIDTVTPYKYCKVTKWVF